jgi:hypothetical protein
MRKDYIWPVICAILVSSLALAIFPFGKPTSFYKLFSGLSINWKVGGVWIDILLDVSFTYLTAAAFAALIASLTFKRSFYLANLTGLVSVVFFVLLTLVANRHSQTAWQPFNIFFWATLYISECVVIFFIVSYWAKIGCFINQYLTHHSSGTPNGAP